jgi:hypothetical protein
VSCWTVLGTFNAVRTTLVILCALLSVGQASSPGVALRVSTPGEVRVGELVSLQVELELPPGAAAPVLLTPSASGESVEVLRGRLSRGDAREVRGQTLRFELPVLARAPGTGLVQVHALAYVCTDVCVAVEREVRASLLVLNGSAAR